MDEKLSNLINSLTELVEKLDDVTTAIAAGTEDFDPMASSDPDAFKKKDKDKEEQNDKLADKIGGFFNKPKKKEPRKILQKVMPISIVNVDNKALKQLKTIIPTPTTGDINTESEEDKSLDFGFLKKIGVGALAAVFAPIVAMITALQTISQSAWFLKLKGLITNSKIFGAIKSAAGSIKAIFGTLGTKFPVLGTIFGKIGGVFGKVLGTVKSVGTTIFGMIKNTKIFAVASKVGKFIGNIFMPIIVLWGAIKTVMGAVKGFKQDGVAGAIKGGVTELFDFLVVDLAKLLASIPAWILEKIGLENMSKSLMATVDGIFDSVKKMFGGIVDVVVGVFTLDMDRLLAGVSDFYGGQVDFAAWLIGISIDPFINFLKDIFNFGDPDSPFSFKEDIIDPAVESIKEWFKNLVALGNTGDGDWSLEKFINEVEKKVISFFTGIFEWGRDDDGSWSLSTFVGTAFTKAKEWITGLFDWENISKTIKEKSTWLKDTVMETWNSVKEWFNNLFEWAEPSSEDGFIISKVKGVVNSVKDWFAKMFKFDSTSSIITSVINLKTWLPNLVISGLSGVTAWFLELFGFDEAASDIKEWESKFSIGGLIVDSVESVWNWFTSLFPEEWSFELPEGMDDIGNYVWNKIKDVWSGVTEIFDKIANFDMGRYVKNEIKNVPGGEWLYDKIWGEEDRALAESAAATKTLTNVGIDDNIAKQAALAQRQSKLGRANEDAQEKTADTYKDLITDAVGDKKSLSSQQIYLLAEALAQDNAAQNTKLGKEVLALTGGKFDSENKKHRDILAKQLRAMYDSEMVGDDVNDDYDKSIDLLSKAAGKQLAKRRVDIDTVNAMVSQIEKVGSVKIGGQILKLDGSTPVTDSMVEEYKRLQQQVTTSTGQEKQALTQYLKALEKAGVSKMIQENKPQPLPSTNFKLEVTPTTPVNRLPVNASEQELKDEWKKTPEYKIKHDVVSRALGTDNHNLLQPRLSQSLEIPPKEFRSSQNIQPATDVELTSKIPGLNTDRATSDIEQAGRNINTGARKISDTVGDHFPKPNSPHAWEYLRMAGENINAGSKRIYEQSLEYNKSENLNKKSSDVDASDLSKKVDKMVQVMVETADIQKKTMQILSDNGLTEKTGDTVVNNGGNTTNISNVTVESDIMSFRDRVVGRLYSK